MGLTRAEFTHDPPDVEVFATKILHDISPLPRASFHGLSSPTTARLSKSKGHATSKNLLHYILHWFIVSIIHSHYHLLLAVHLTLPVNEGIVHRSIQTHSHTHHTQMHSPTGGHASHFTHQEHLLPCSHLVWGGPSLAYFVEIRGLIVYLPTLCKNELNMQIYNTTLRNFESSTGNLELQLKTLNLTHFHPMQNLH